jgi:hypothetical protein
MSYKDGYQKKYFVLDSFQEGARQLKEYAAHLRAERAKASSSEGSAGAASNGGNGHVSTR